jgi:PHD/YefM family antitoxin component YafN of YafNO toxin-antitoxin module
MEFLTVRDFRTSPRAVWEKLSSNGKVVITNNGKPAALMLEVDGSTLEETLDTLRQAETLRLISKIQLQSVKNGTDAMTMDEIDAEIAAARAELSASQGAGA